MTAKLSYGSWKLYLFLEPFLSTICGDSCLPISSTQVQPYYRLVRLGLKTPNGEIDLYK